MNFVREDGKEVAAGYLGRDGGHSPALEEEADVGLCYLTALYVFAVMNCKNVVTEDYHLPRPIRRRDARMSFSIRRVTVRGSRHAVRDEDHEPSAEALDRARHICRGHFRDYTEGKGLFGRSNGIYWTPPHMRGHVRSGLVVKSYEVKLPPEQVQ